ncbi:MAG: hypothetical protein IKC21_01375 [Ruminococcus sp.]|nr:hypothetical protein [Ruminococcus sp.]
MQKKPMIGVIVGRVYESVQKVMLEGIISQAEKYNFDTAIISNIHNASYMEYFAFIEVENKIYELIESPQLDGIIVMGRSARPHTFCRSLRLGAGCGVCS